MKRLNFPRQDIDGSISKLEDLPKQFKDFKSPFSRCKICKNMGMAKKVYFEFFR